MDMGTQTLICTLIEQPPWEVVDSIAFTRWGNARPLAISWLDAVPKRDLSFPKRDSLYFAPMLLSDALFTVTQQKVLGLLYGKPDQSFYANEIVRAARVGKGSVMRELDRLQRSGVLTLARQGNQTRYQANPACPIYAELVSIVRKTFGVVEQLRLALEPVAGQVTWAFVYGSIAKGTAQADSDVDLMLIGDGLQYTEIMELLLPVEERLGRQIHPTLYSLNDWKAERASGNSFVLRVEQQEKLPVLGGNPLEATDGT